MAEYERSRTMHARPEQVFDQAADVGQLDTWIPDAVCYDPPLETRAPAAPCPGGRGISTFTE